MSYMPPGPLMANLWDEDAIGNAAGPMPKLLTESEGPSAGRPCGPGMS